MLALDAQRRPPGARLGLPHLNHTARFSLQMIVSVNIKRPFCKTLQL